MAQSRPVNQIVIVVDDEREGASETRNRAWRALYTEWVAFLDDDDYWYPNHIEVLTNHAEQTGADVVYPWYDCINDPFPQFEGLEWNDEVPHLFPMAYMVRKSLLEETGGFPSPPMPSGDCSGEDWALVEKYVAAGAKISHVPVRTWNYCHHGDNTSGLAFWSNGMAKW